MTYKLVLLRHGQSEWNEKNLFTGWVDVNLTDSEKKPETTPPPAPSQEEQQAASENNEPIVSDPAANQPQNGDTQNGSIYIEGFGWIPDEGGGTIQEEVHSDGDINKQETVQMQPLSGNLSDYWFKIALLPNEVIITALEIMATTWNDLRNYTWNDLRSYTWNELRYNKI